MTLLKNKTLSVDDHAFIHKIFQSTTVSDEALLAHWVEQIKGKSERTERIIVISHFKVITIKKNLTTSLRISKTYHLMDLTSFRVDEDLSGTILQFSFSNIGSLCVQAGVYSEEICRCTQRSLNQTYHNFPLELKAKLEIPRNYHWEEIAPQLTDFDGFCNTYRAFCSYYGTPYRNCVADEISRYFSGKHDQDLDLAWCFHKCRDPPANVDDAKALIKTIRSCDFFEGIIIQDFALGDQGSICLFDALCFNQRIKRVVLRQAKITRCSFVALQNMTQPQEDNEMLGQKKCALSGLRQLDISENTISRESCAILASTLKTMVVGLEVFALESCKLNGKSVGQLISSMKSPKWTSSLRELNLSYNKIDKEGSTAIADWIPCSCLLQKLHLASTNLDTAIFMTALRRNTLLHKSSLEYLNLSYNRFTGSSAEDLGYILSETSSLSDVELKGMQISKKNLLDIFRPMSRNTNEKLAFTVDLSDNDLSGGKATHLAQLLKESPMMRRNFLVLNNCSLGNESLSQILEALRYCSELNALSLNDNVSASASFIERSPDSSASSLQLLLESSKLEPEGPPLRELYLTSSKVPFSSRIILAAINALLTNKTLQALDISGNRCGNVIAEALAKVLRVNSVLRGLFWDNSKTTIEGFRVFSEALDLNRSLILVPVSIHDCRRILEQRNPPRDELFAIIGNIYRCVERNQETNELPLCLSRRSLLATASHNSGTNSASHSWNDMTDILTGSQESIINEQLVEEDDDSSSKE